MTTLSATEARKNFFELIKSASEQHESYRIQHRKGAVILLSEEDYEGFLETLELLSIPALRKSITRSMDQMRKGETIINR